MGGRFVIVALLIATMPSIVTGQSIQDSAACIASNEQVSVIAQKFTEGPPSYSFRVANHTDSSIAGIVLGRDEELHIIPHTPTSMGSPEGWEARQVFGHESQNMHFFWSSESSEVQIQGGQSLSGFSLQLNDWKHEQPQYFQGDLVVQADLRVTSFFVWMADGACYTGRVRPDSL